MSEVDETIRETFTRKVKSVNFTDEELFEFAIKRADAHFEGNFSRYMQELVVRDRASPVTKKLMPEIDINRYMID